MKELEEGRCWEREEEEEERTSSGTSATNYLAPEGRTEVLKLKRHLRECGVNKNAASYPQLLLRGRGSRSSAASAAVNSPAPARFLCPTPRGCLNIQVKKCAARFLCSSAHFPSASRGLPARRAGRNEHIYISAKKKRVFFFFYSCLFHNVGPT